MLDVMTMYGQVGKMLLGHLENTMSSCGNDLIADTTIMIGSAGHDV